MKPDWELYRDEGCYDMWAVRDAHDRSFNSPRLFHFAFKEDAESFLKLIKKSNCAEAKP